MTVSAGGIAMRRPGSSGGAGDLDALGARPALRARRRSSRSERARVLLDRCAQARAMPVRAGPLDEVSELCVVEARCRPPARRSRQLHLRGCPRRLLLARERGFARRGGCALGRPALERAETTDFDFIRAQIGLLCAEIHALAGTRRRRLSRGSRGARICSTRRATSLAAARFARAPRRSSASSYV